MRCQLLAALLLCMILSPIAMAQTEGRAPPSCSESNFADISNSLSLDAGLCWKMNLGTLQPGDVYEVEINIINDAIDVLFFDQSTIQPYDLGQSLSFPI